MVYITTYGYNVIAYKTTRYLVVVTVVVYLVYIQQVAAMGSNCFWYKLAGGLYGYLDWGNCW
jgi:hypothetical protein